MRYTADTQFFIKLAERNQQALHIWQEILKGKSKLIVPTAVLTELTRQIRMKGKEDKLEPFLESIRGSNKIFLLVLTYPIAVKAGDYAYSFNMTSIDAIILATALETGYINILTADEHFKAAEKQGKIKRVLK